MAGLSQYQPFPVTKGDDHGGGLVFQALCFSLEELCTDAGLPPIRCLHKRQEEADGTKKCHVCPQWLAQQRGLCPELFLKCENSHTHTPS